MADYVYLLSTYNEYGSEEVRATTDRSLVPALLAASWVLGDGRVRVLEHGEAARLSELLARPDDKLAGKLGRGADPHDLNDYWGGPQLHVVRLEK